MSGREHEPVAAFFPSIDRNLIRDLDRHLRNHKPSDAPGGAPEAPSAPVPARSGPRPNIANVVEAVEHAASSIAAMTARIDELESHIDGLEAMNRQLEAQLAEAGQAIQVTESKLRAEGERASRIEGVAAHQAARVVDLERELSAAHGDLARVTEAIAAALGLPEDGASA